MPLFAPVTNAVLFSIPPLLLYSTTPIFQHRLRIRRQFFYIPQFPRDRPRANIDIFNLARGLIEFLLHSRQCLAECSIGNFASIGSHTGAPFSSPGNLIANSTRSSVSSRVFMFWANWSGVSISSSKTPSCHSLQ